MSDPNRQDEYGFVMNILMKLNRKQHCFNMYEFWIVSAQVDNCVVTTDEVDSNNDDDDTDDGHNYILRLAYDRLIIKISDDTENLQGLIGLV